MVPCTHCFSIRKTAGHSFRHGVSQTPVAAQFAKEPNQTFRQARGTAGSKSDQNPRSLFFCLLGRWLICTLVLLAALLLSILPELLLLAFQQLFLFALHVVFFIQYSFPLRSLHGLRPLVLG